MKYCNWREAADALRDMEKYEEPEDPLHVQVTSTPAEMTVYVRSGDCEIPMHVDGFWITKETARKITEILTQEANNGGV